MKLDLRLLLQLLLLLLHQMLLLLLQILLTLLLKSLPLLRLLHLELLLLKLLLGRGEALLLQRLNLAQLAGHGRVGRAWRPREERGEKDGNAPDGQVGPRGGPPGLGDFNHARDSVFDYSNPPRSPPPPPPPEKRP